MKLHTLLSKGVIAVALVGTAGTVLAHTAWLEPAGGDGQYRVVFGGHEGKTEPYAASKVGAVSAFATNGAALAVERRDTADGVQLQVGGKAAVLLMRFDNGIWSKPDGGRSVNKPMNEVAGATSGVHAMKYHKTIAQWTDSAFRAWGQPFELVPVELVQPQAGVPLKLRVLVDGKPAAGIKLAIDEDAPGVTSDAEGLASIVPSAGFNKIWAGQRTEVKGDPRYTTLSIEYILGFEVPSSR